MSECTHNCESCGENCAERQMKPEDFLEKPHELSSVLKVVGVVSGKGGVELFEGDWMDSAADAVEALGKPS